MNRLVEEAVTTNDDLSAPDVADKNFCRADMSVPIVADKSATVNSGNSNQVRTWEIGNAGMADSHATLCSSPKMAPLQRATCDHMNDIMADITDGMNNIRRSKKAQRNADKAMHFTL